MKRGESKIAGINLHVFWCKTLADIGQYWLFSNKLII